MKKDLTQLILVVDKSSSMSSARMTTISGLKEFVDTQKQLPGEALLTYITFSTDYKVEFENKNLQDVDISIFDEYRTTGCTALLDAIGIAIDSVGNRLYEMEESNRPEKVMMIILTDGEENSSKEYKINQIKEKVKHQESVYKWEFLFLGADIDAISAGSSINMSKSVKVNKFDMGANLKKASVYTGSYRGSDINDSASLFNTVSTEFFSYSDDQLNTEVENLKNAKS